MQDRALVEPRRGRSRARERVVLAAALGAATVLASASSFAGGDPELSARASVERLAEAGASAVSAVWRRMLVEEGPAPAAGEVVAWRAGDPLDVEDAPPASDEGAGSRSFALLLAVAERTELARGEGAQALADLEELLARTDGDPPLRARALSRAVRLAVRLGDLERARRHFELARSELTGDEAERAGDAAGERGERPGVSSLLFAGLALAPALEPAQRAEIVELLIERWSAGELALPGGDPELATEGDPPRLVLRDDPLRRALRERLEALAPAADPRLAARERARRARALSAAAGELEAPADGAWRLVRTPIGELALRAGPDGERTAQLAAPGAAAERLRERVEAAGLLPEDVSLELEGQPAPPGERVRGPEALPGGDLRFALRHADPKGFLAAELWRARLLRAGLLLAAVTVAGAGVAAARAMARERRLVELRARFVASVTHELRTPLTSILMLAENFEQGRAADPARRARYPALIRREAERLRRLVADVLDAARLEQGAPPRVAREEVSLPRSAAELARELERMAARSGRALRVDVGELPERGWLDREALRRAAENLVDNALKHGAPEHGGERRGDLGRAAPHDAAALGIEVALTAADGRLHLAVRDHGPGLPPARREAAFRPFERLDAPAARGAGLGLWIVRELARAHGGDAWLADPPAGTGALAVLELALDEPGSGARGTGEDEGARGVA